MEEAKKDDDAAARWQKAREARKSVRNERASLRLCFRLLTLCVFDQIEIVAWAQCLAAWDGFDMDAPTRLAKLARLAHVVYLHAFQPVKDANNMLFRRHFSGVGRMRLFLEYQPCNSSQQHPPLPPPQQRTGEVGPLAP